MTEFLHVVVSIAAAVVSTGLLFGVPLALTLRFPGKPRP